MLKPSQNPELSQALAQHWVWQQAPEPPCNRRFPDAGPSVPFLKRESWGRTEHEAETGSPCDQTHQP